MIIKVDLVMTASYQNKNYNNHDKEYNCKFLSFYLMGKFRDAYPEADSDADSHSKSDSDNN